MGRNLLDVLCNKTAMISIETPWRWGYINTFTCNISFKHSHGDNSKSTFIHVRRLQERYTKWKFPKLYYPGLKEHHKNQDFWKYSRASFWITLSITVIFDSSIHSYCILNLFIVIYVIVYIHVYIAIHVNLNYEMYFTYTENDRTSTYLPSNQLNWKLPMKLKLLVVLLNSNPPSPPPETQK